jgi:hypothetical protein
MFRVTFLIDDPAERRRLADELRSLTMGGDARIVSAFADAKSVEVYLEVGETVVWREVTDQLARRLGVDDYEVTRAEPLPTAPPASAAEIDRRRLRPAAITQVRVHADGRTLSVQARHRHDETVETVEVQQTDEAVAITVLLGAPDDDVREQYVSFAVAFTWVDTTLDRPVGNRRVTPVDPDRRASRSQPVDDEARLERSHEWVELIESTEPDADADEANWSAWGPHLI